MGKEKLTNNEKILEPIGVRMKKYEDISKKITNVLPYQSFILRLDGNKFSTFTKKLRKPFDNVFMLAMVNTCEDLVRKFHCCTGYTHSDEITLIFSACCSKSDYDNGLNKSEHLFSGRTNKLLTLTASLCSVRFNFHITEIVKKLPKLDREHFEKNSFLEHMENDPNAIFDSRLVLPLKEIPSQKIDTLKFSIEELEDIKSELEGSTIYNNHTLADNEVSLLIGNLTRLVDDMTSTECDYEYDENLVKNEIVNHMMWRSVFDCYRNCVSTYADWKLGKKQTFGMHSREKMEQMKKMGLDMSNEPLYYKHGIYMKKILYETEVEYVHGKTGEKMRTMAKRSKYIKFMMVIRDCENGIGDFLLNKYFPEDKNVKFKYELFKNPIIFENGKLS